MGKGQNGSARRWGTRAGRHGPQSAIGDRQTDSGRRMDDEWRMASNSSSDAAAETTAAKAAAMVTAATVAATVARQLQQR